MIPWVPFVRQADMMDTTTNSTKQFAGFKFVACMRNIYPIAARISLPS